MYNIISDMLLVNSYSVFGCDNQVSGVSFFAHACKFDANDRVLQYYTNENLFTFSSKKPIH